jgi:hypothetical protein
MNAAQLARAERQHYFLSEAQPETKQEYADRIAMECWDLNPQGEYSLQEAVEDEIEDLVEAIILASKTDINLNKALRASLQTYANRIAGVSRLLWN